MGKLIDISQLGMRPITYVEVGEIVDPKTRVSTLGSIRKTRMRQQPILTAEEAVVLKEEDWNPSPECYKVYGSFMCSAGGRRWFCDIDPSAVIEKPTPKPTTKPVSTKGKDAPKP